MTKKEQGIYGIYSLFFFRHFHSSFLLIYSIDCSVAIYSNGIYSFYLTDDGLLNRPKHVLQIEKYCRVSSCTI